MALTISDAEAKMSLDVTRPAYETLALANDFFSWQKEYDDFLQNAGSEDMANAVWIIMKEHAVGIDEAKRLCKDKVASSCREYLEKKKSFEMQFGDTVSPDLMRYLSALELSISGNVVWSQYSPRYNFQAEFDEAALIDVPHDSDSSLSSLIQDMVGEYSDVSSAPASDSESDPRNPKYFKEREAHVEQRPHSLIDSIKEYTTPTVCDAGQSSVQENVALKLGLPSLSDKVSCSEIHCHGK